LEGYHLRIYSWDKPCITIGWRQKLADIPNPEDLEIAKRPTGGGIVYHQPGEVTYCLVVPLSHPNLPKGILPSCNYLAEGILNALSRSGVKAQIAGGKPASKSELCFAQPEAYEIVYEGKKIVGNAQRRGKKALLQQGTLNIRTPHDFENILAEELKRLLG
jgi:lipoate-protein ligase A